MNHDPVGHVVALGGRANGPRHAQVECAPFLVHIATLANLVTTVGCSREPCAGEEWEGLAESARKA